LTVQGSEISHEQPDSNTTKPTSLTALGTGTVNSTDPSFAQSAIVPSQAAMGDAWPPSKNWVSCTFCRDYFNRW
jgi:hypothetical protein